MGGILGIGGSSAKTDRATQLSAQQGLWNVFGYGLDNSKAAQKSGTSSLGDAAAYFKSLLTAGRSQTAQNAAPAINSQIAQTDAARREEAATGTGRTGGTTAANREASTTSMKSIDDIINKNLIEGRKVGAEGLASIGSTELQDALASLGIATGADTSIMQNATASRGQSQQIHDDSVAGYGKAIGSLVGMFL